MLPTAPFRKAASHDEVARQVQLVLWHNQPPLPKLERRYETRYPFPHPIRLVPVDDEGKPCGESIVVLGKDLSEYGLGFYHNEPLAERRMMAIFDCGPLQAQIVLELTWCRFGSHGLFENGGRFLEALTAA